MAAEAGPYPFALRATTAKRYVSPLVRPETVYELVVGEAPRANQPDQRPPETVRPAESLIVVLAGGEPLHAVRLPVGPASSVFVQTA